VILDTVLYSLVQKFGVKESDMLPEEEEEGGYTDIQREGGG
jgi:hypothetical protein